MSIKSVERFKLLYEELNDLTKKLPLYSQEVVEISQELDQFIIHAMKRQIENS